MPLVDDEKARRLIEDFELDELEPSASSRELTESRKRLLEYMFLEKRIEGSLLLYPGGGADVIHPILMTHARAITIVDIDPETLRTKTEEERFREWVEALQSKGGDEDNIAISQMYSRSPPTRSDTSVYIKRVDTGTRICELSFKDYVEKLPVEDTTDTAQVFRYLNTNYEVGHGKLGVDLPPVVSTEIKRRTALEQKARQIKVNLDHVSGENSAIGYGVPGMATISNPYYVVTLYAETYVEYGERLEAGPSFDIIFDKDSWIDDESWPGHIEAIAAKHKEGGIWVGSKSISHDDMEEWYDDVKNDLFGGLRGWGDCGGLWSFGNSYLQARRRKGA